MSRTTILILFATMATAANQSHAGPSPEVIDQSADELFYMRNLAAYSMAQSFTPAHNLLDFVDLSLADMTTAPYEMTIHLLIVEGTLGGSVLGTSETVSLSDCFNFPGGPGCGSAGGYPVPIRFEFSETVQLSAGQLYWIDLRSADNVGVGHTLTGTYPGGALLVDGVNGGGDLWFREGYYVPEPTSLTLLCLGVAAVVRRRSQLGSN